MMRETRLIGAVAQLHHRKPNWLCNRGKQTVGNVKKHQAKRGIRFPTGDGDVAGVTKIIFSKSTQATQSSP